MVTRKTWEEFREAGLLWWVNRTLHLFGWAIVVEVDGDRVTDAYPARVRFRGFDEKSEAAGFVALTEHISANAPALCEECRDEPDAPAGQNINNAEAKVSMHTCVHCGVEIKPEDDDMITCGGVFEVWYSELPNGKRSMSCSNNQLRAHQPLRKESNGQS